MKIYRISSIFFLTLLLTLTGCVQPPPVLLRNRPNVPPPVVEPTDTENAVPVIKSGVIETEKPEVVEVITTIPAQLPPPDIKTAPITYTVKKGDSFWKIARMYGVTQSELATCNNLSLKKPLKTGTELLIPPGGAFIPEEKRPPIKKRVAPTRTVKQQRTITSTKSNYVPSLKDGKYTVQRGDSLWSIARRFNTTTSLLMQANDMNKGTILHVGKTLIIPGAGDTLNKPAKKKKNTHKKQKTTKNRTNYHSQVVSDADELLKDAEVSTTESVLPSETSALDAIPSMNTTKKKPVAPVKPKTISKNVSMQTTLPSTQVSDLDKATEIVDTEPAGALYTEEVLPNETLQDIADRHGMTPEDIIAVNPGLSLDTKLKPFTSIKIPNK